MRTEFTLQVRRFQVVVREMDTGEEREDEIVLTLEQLRACQLVGQSSKELIHRLCARRGLEVVDIGKATKREICMNLCELYRAYCLASRGKREAPGGGPYEVDQDHN